MAFHSREELAAIGFQTLGDNVSISRKASIYGAPNIRLGSNVRIDDFCILSAGSGGITIGSFIHIAAYSSIVGHEKVELSDFSNLSARVSIYSSSDDFSGNWMTNPTVPPEFTGVTHAPVFIGRHVIIGAGSLVLPGAILENGVAVGGLSLVRGRCLEFGIYSGVPARRKSERKRNLLELEKRLLASLDRTDQSIET
jgi:dTDP-4-amino-4,6-dideoxy-D-glucose acyltransferase